jgi:hypothetical protein
MAADRRISMPAFRAKIARSAGGVGSKRGKDDLTRGILPSGRDAVKIYTCTRHSCATVLARLRTAAQIESIAVSNQ